MVSLMAFPCLRVNGDFFASADHRTGDLVVKLAESCVNELIAAGVGQAFAPAGRRFRQWLAIPHRDAEQWRQLVLLLSSHPQGDKPQTHALLALLCFHAARLSGRMDDDGTLLQLATQDRTQWDQALIASGFHFLEKAAVGDELSEYHLEAGIAALHCAAPTYSKLTVNIDGTNRIE